MLYTTFQIGEQEYKLRMPAAQIVELEKKLGGRNPLDILMGIEAGKMPSVSSVLLILHASMQKFHHSISFEKVTNLYDDLVDEGKTYTDLMPVLMDVFKVSGFFKGEKAEEVTQENQLLI